MLKKIFNKFTALILILIYLLLGMFIWLNLGPLQFGFGNIEKESRYSLFLELIIYILAIGLIYYFIITLFVFLYAGIRKFYVWLLMKEK